MSFSRFLLAAGAATALSAAAAAAQDASAEQEAEAPRLSDLDRTLDELLQEEGQPTASPAAPEPAVETSRPAAAEPAAPAPPLTAAQTAELERTVARGRLLIAIARAGILATQDMLSRVSDPEGAGVVGWIAEPNGAAMTVTFYGRGEEGTRAVYRAEVMGGRVVSRQIYLGEDRPALRPIQARMAAARAATEGLDHSACTDQPFNVLVVPPASASAPVEVYQLSAPALRGRFPLGGHFRSTVAADGTVAESRGFAEGCRDIVPPPAADGEPSRPITVVHRLDPMPTEIHLLLAQMAGRPLVVATGEPLRTWLVTGERIAEIRP